MGRSLMLLPALGKLNMQYCYWMLRSFEQKNTEDYSYVGNG